jgi:hypothetical protein
VVVLLSYVVCSAVWRLLWRVNARLILAGGEDGCLMAGSVSLVLSCRAHSPLRAACFLRAMCRSWPSRADLATAPAYLVDIVMSGFLLM